MTNDVRSGIEVVAIYGQDGLDQIASYIRDKANVKSIHIFSHGEKGVFYFGNEAITNYNISIYRDTLTAIGNGLRSDGEILLYGCSIAKGESGETLIHRIADYTHTSVAASTDATGNAVLGGNWDIEFRVGSTNMDSAIIAQSNSHFNSLLTEGAPILTSGFSIGSNVEHTATIGGNTVADYLNGHYTSATEHTIGIAVTGADEGWSFQDGNGIWWNFNRPGVLSASNALLLSADTPIRFEPSYYYNGTASFNFRVWDQNLGGTNQQGNNLSNLGIGSAISVDEKMATVDVHPVNDAPTVSSNLGVASFTGAGEYFQGPALTIGGAFTFEAWVKLDRYTNWSRIWDFGNGTANNNIIVGQYGSSGQLFFEVYQGGNSPGKIVSSTQLPLNQWVRVAATIDNNGNAKFYQDGVLVGSAQWSVAPTIERVNNYLGKSNWGQDLI
ncbi:hypothetical protein CCP2SC5_120002 [Azospirillaceae bacterium]